jgi:SOS-response transcriptional repressor LexA
MQAQSTPARRASARLKALAGPNVFLFPSGKPAASKKPPANPSLTRQRQQVFDELFGSSDETVDLSKWIVPRPLHTVYVFMCGGSMEPGIFPEDYVIVDSAEPFNSGDVVAASFNNELLIKRLRVDEKGQCWLDSDNPEYESIPVPARCVFGKVTRVLHDLKKGGSHDGRG